MLRHSARNLPFRLSMKSLLVGLLGPPDVERHVVHETPWPCFWRPRQTLMPRGTTVFSVLLHC